MVYIIIFAIILCGIYRYDFLSRTDAKLGVFSYIFILLTCVSVLKYRVGSDILVYMSEYGDYLPLNKLTVSYVFDNANNSSKAGSKLCFCCSCCPKYTKGAKSK